MIQLHFGRKIRKKLIEETQREIETIQERLEKDDQSYRHYVNEVLLVEYDSLSEIEQGTEKDKFISNSPKIMRKSFSENFEKSHIKSMFLSSLRWFCKKL